MPVMTICENVLQVGAVHPDRVLFDSLMPTPHGTTYNSYLVIGKDKTALIDAVDPIKTNTLLRNLKEAGISKIDYLINLHTEQDHAGGNGAVLRKYPMAQLVGNAKIQEMLATHLHIDPNKVKIVAEGDVLDLGGKTLQFKMIPFAHWPDNMMAWLPEDDILFSSDLFGSHYSSTKVFSTSSSEQRFAAKTYFAEIMMPFSSKIAQYTKDVQLLRPRMIAPAHGPVWYDPEMILSRYERWTSPAVKKLVTIPFISMHDSTRSMVERLAIRLSKQGISIICRDLGHELDSLTVETGHFITDLVDAAAMIIATPTVLGGPHPNIAYATVVANAIRPQTPFFGVIGSYGWATQAVKTIDALSGNIKAERLEPIMVKGLPTDEDMSLIDDMAVNLANKIKALPDLIQ